MCHSPVEASSQLTYAYINYMIKGLNNNTLFYIEFEKKYKLTTNTNNRTTPNTFILYILFYFEKDIFKKKIIFYFILITAGILYLYFN